MYLCILYIYIIYYYDYYYYTGNGDAEEEGNVKKFCTMHVCAVGAKPVIDRVVVVTETPFGIVKECV